MDVFLFPPYFISETFINLRKFQRDVMNVRSYSGNLPDIPAGFNRIRNFSRFLNNNPILNFMKICPVLAELLHLDGRTDRQTDRHGKANSRFW
jgi:hypothetical protein